MPHGSRLPRRVEAASLGKVTNVSGRQPPEQQAPPVQKLRVRYTKRGRARFTSHRDFGRAFERALRRAGVPMAYSSGFSPHPRISYANAAPTGAASESEYLELGLAAVCDPAKVRAALDEALPHGLDVLEVVPARPGALADLLTGSRWRIDLIQVDPDLLAESVDLLLGQTSVEVNRMTKKGLRTFDARRAVVAIRAAGSSVDLVLAHQTPLVRPDDILAALAIVSPSFGTRDDAVLTRVSQGILDPDSGEIADPLVDPEA